MKKGVVVLYSLLLFFCGSCKDVYGHGRNDSRVHGHHMRDARQAPTSDKKLNIRSRGSDTSEVQVDHCMLDLTFIVDESRKTGALEWEKVIIPFVTGTVEKLNVSKTGTNVGVMFFSNTFRDIVKFGSTASSDRSLLVTTINQYKKTSTQGAGTFLVEALKRGLKEYTESASGRFVPKVTLLFTAGNETQQFGYAALEQVHALYKERNVSLLVVGIGDAGIQEMNLLGGCAQRTRGCPSVFSGSILQLDSLIPTIVKKIDEKKRCGMSEEAPDAVDQECANGACYCNGKFDVSLVIDESASVGSAQWKNSVIPFVTSIVDQLDVSKKGVRMEVVFFSSQVRKIVQFTDENSFDKHSLLQKLRSYAEEFESGGGTYIVDALTHVLKEADTAGEDVHRHKSHVTILFTDGDENKLLGDEPLKKIHQSFVDRKMKLLVVGVGEASTKNLFLLGGCSDVSQVCPGVFESTFSKLQSVVPVVVESICDLKYETVPTEGDPEKEEEIVVPEEEEVVIPEEEEVVIPEEEEVVIPEEEEVVIPEEEEVVIPEEEEVVVPEEETEVCVGEKCLCENVYDVTLIIDESGSINNKRWKKQVIPFTASVIQHLSVGLDKVHVGIMFFSDKVRDIVRFGDELSYKQDELVKKVEKYANDYGNGSGTHIIDSLRSAITNYSEDPKGRNVPKVTILFTDGDESKRFGDAALKKIHAEYEAKNIKLLIVGVGRVTRRKLNILGGCKGSASKCAYVLKANFDDLQNLTPILTNKICNTEEDVPEEPQKEDDPPVVDDPVVGCKGDECYCQNVYDLTLVVESGAYISQSTWEQYLVPFWVGVVENTEVDQGHVHIGLMFYSEKYSDVVQFGDATSYDKKSLIAKIQQHQESVEFVAPVHMLDALKRSMSVYSDSEKSRDVPKVTILYTQGGGIYFTTEEELAAVNLMYREKNVKLLLVGLDLPLTASKLRIVGGCQSRDMDCPYVNLVNYYELPTVASTITKKICGTTIPEEIVPIHPVEPLEPHKDENEVECEGEQCLCDDIFDITLVIDESGSIMTSRWKQWVIPFTVSVLKNLAIEKDKVHVGVMFFSDMFRDIVQFDSPMSYQKEELIEYVDSYKDKYGKGPGTYIVDALQRAVTMYSENSFGRKVPKVTILFTDGDENRVTGDMALVDVNQLYQQKHIKLLVVGVDPATTRNLNLLSGCDADATNCPFVFSVKFDMLESIVTVLTEKICKTEPTPPGPDPPVLCEGDDCYCQDTYDLTMLIDQSNNIEEAQWHAQVKPFISGIVNQLPVEKNKVHVGLMYFADKFKDIVRFGEAASSDKSQLLQKIKQQSRTSASFDEQTFLLLAMKRGILEYSEDKNSRNVPKVTIVMTSTNDKRARSDDEYDHMNQEYAARKIKLLLVGVSPADISKLNMLGGCAANDVDCPFVTKTNLEELQYVVMPLTEKICDTPVYRPDEPEEDDPIKPVDPEKCEGENCFCEDVYDVTLVMDESLSIGKKRWKNQVIPFTVGILENLAIAEDKVHVGIMFFSNKFRDIVRFGQTVSYSPTELIALVQTYAGNYAAGGGTYIVNALQRAITEYSANTKSRQHVPKVTILFTDGDENKVRGDKALVNVNKQYKESNIRLLVVGVGDASKSKLNLLAGCDSKEKNCVYVIKVDFEALPSIASSLTDKICDVPVEPVIPDEPIVPIHPIEPIEPIIPDKPEGCEGENCFCEDKYDVTLIIDESHSIGKSRWKKQVIPFTVGILENLVIAEDKVHVGIMFFSDSFRDMVRFGQPVSYTKKDLIKKAKKYSKDYIGGGGTYIVNALQRAINDYSHYKNSRTNVPKVTILFTDGDENKVHGDEALVNVNKQYKEGHVRLLVVGVGQASPEKLNMLAGCASTDANCVYVIKVDFDALPTIASSLTAKICDIPVEPVIPDEPIVPIHPIEPIIPDEPIVPIHPIEPIIPDEPIVPIHPIEPIIPDEPIVPIHPIEPIIPDEPEGCTGDNCFCEEAFDALLLIDESPTVGVDRWQNNVIPFTVKLLQSLNIGRLQVHACLVFFASEMRDISQFGDPLSFHKEELIAKVEASADDYIGGVTTRFTAALEKGLTRYRLNPLQRNVPKLTVIFTNGTDSTVPEQHMLEVRDKYRALNIRLVLIGVGGAMRNELNIFGGCDEWAVDCPGVFFGEFSDLDVLVTKVNMSLCGNPAPPIVDDPEECIGETCFCESLFEATFMIDESTNIGMEKWQDSVIPFLSKMVQSLDISEHKVHASVLYVSDDVRDIVRFGEETSHDKEKLVAKIEASVHDYSDRPCQFTNSALLEALLKYAQDPNTRNVPKLAVLLTGASESVNEQNDKALLASRNQYRESNVQLVLIGVGKAVHGEMNVLGGCSETDAYCPGVFHGDFSELDGFVGGIEEIICGEPNPDPKPDPKPDPTPDPNECVGEECFCNDKYDVTLVIDESGSIGFEKWKSQVIPFTEAIIDTLMVAKDKVHVGVMFFAEFARDIVKFGDEVSSDKPQLLEKIRSYRKDYEKGRETFLVQHLEGAIKNYSESPLSRTDVPKVTIAFTDGEETGHPGALSLQHVSQQYQAKNIKLLLVGVGKATLESLNLLGGCKSSDKNCPFVIRARFEDLQNIVPMLKDKICNTTPEDIEKMCENPLNIALLLDQSVDISRDQWEHHVKVLATRIVEQNTIEKTGTNITVMPMKPGGAPLWEMGSRTSYDKSEILENISEMLKYDVKKKNVPEYLRTLRETVFNKILSTKRKVIMMFVEGKSASRLEDLRIELELLRINHIELFVFALDNINEEEYKLYGNCEVAGTECKNVVKLAWTELEKAAADKMEHVCKYGPYHAECNVWGEWSACPEDTCDSIAMSRRERLMPYTLVPETVEGSLIGTTCEEQGVIEYRVCESSKCDEVCGEFGEWSNCSVTCGNGIRIKKRDPSMLHLPQCAHLNNVVVERCTNPACDVTNNCDQVGEWSDWSECSHTCGYSIKTRTFEIPKSVLEQYPNCLQYSRTEVDVCEVPSCEGEEPVEEPCFEWSDWSEWSGSCGEVTRRQYAIRTPGANEHCEESYADKIETEEKEECGTSHCGEWSEWSECDKTCDNGVRVRHFITKYEPTLLGSSDELDECEELYDAVETTTCLDLPFCDETDECDEWELWVDCPAVVCDSTHSRVFTRRHDLVQNPVAHPAEVCASLPQFKEEACELSGDSFCADAVCSLWAEWGPCSATCGESHRVRERMLPIELEPAKPRPDGTMGLSCEAQGILLEEMEVCDVPAECENGNVVPPNGDDEPEEEEKKGGGGGGRSTAEKVSMAAGGLLLLGAIAGAAYAYNGATGGVTPDTSNMEFATEDAQAGDAVESGEEFNVVDPDDPSWN